MNVVFFFFFLGLENDDSAVQYAIGRSDTVAPGVGIDLEFDADVQTMSPEASEYETCYVTSHKGPCRVASYSRDGQLIATGSADASIKILDTERMLAKSAMPIEVSLQRCLTFYRLWIVCISCKLCTFILTVPIKITGGVGGENYHMKCGSLMVLGCLAALGPA